MTASTDQAAAAAALNGQGAAPAAAPAGEPCADCATPSERVMGAIGLLFAIGLVVIAVDLISGGAVSRFASGLFAAREGAEGGQPGAG